jgi:regulatory protein
MEERYPPVRKRKRPGKPLDPARLDELALAYVARFATSAGRLEAYLNRKLRERGWDESCAEPPHVEAIVSRFVERGYVDDESFARARSGGLLRRGYGPRRVAQALAAVGIDEEVCESVKSGEAVDRKAALVMARKRSFGPFGQARDEDGLDRAAREKQIAAMLRAGHTFDIVRQVIDAESIDMLEDWLREAELEEE